MHPQLLQGLNKMRILPSQNRLLLSYPVIRQYYAREIVAELEQKSRPNFGEKSTPGLVETIDKVRLGTIYVCA